MDMSFYRRGLIFILYIVLLSSCSNITIFSTPTPEPLSSWIQKWLNDPSCQPPCWEHLVPGETNIQDGAEILSHVSDVKITWYPTTNPATGYQQVMWDFVNPGEGGAATTEKNGQEIATISLMISDTQRLTIEQVFSSYGFPSDILLYDCRGEITAKACAVHLIYKNGMALELLLPDEGKNTHEVTIQKNSKVERIWFFPLSDNSYGEAIGMNSGYFPQYLVAWRDFGPYP